jgi:hypothetical protein
MGLFPPFAGLGICPINICWLIQQTCGGWVSPQVACPHSWAAFCTGTVVHGLFQHFEKPKGYWTINYFFNDGFNSSLLVNLGICEVKRSLKKYYAKWEKPVQRATYDPFMWNVQKRQIHRDRKIGGCQGLGWEENGEWLLMGWWECSEIRLQWWLHNAMRILKTTGLYAWNISQ